MNIADLLAERAVTTHVKSHTKEDVIRDLVGLRVQAGSIKEKDVSRLVQILLKRESLGSTGIGQGVAIPHGKSDCVTQLVGAFGVSETGVDFDSLDGEPVHLFFILIAPQNSTGTHLKILAKISRLLKDKFFRQALRESKSPEEVLKQIQDENEY